jgi:hypothetical protein
MVLSGEIVGIVASIVAGTVQVVIIIPKLTVKNALPIIAGLNILAPSPPKTILPTAIAKQLPVIAAQSGMAGGSDNARIKPVITALKSPRDSSGLDFLRIRLQSHSVTTAEITHVATSIRA